VTQQKYAAKINFTGNVINNIKVECGLMPNVMAALGI